MKTTTTTMRKHETLQTHKEHGVTRRRRRMRRPRAVYTEGEEMKEDEGKRKSRRGQKPPFRASVSPFSPPRDDISSSARIFAPLSASSLDFRLYRPALKHPSLSLSNLERPSPRCLRRAPPTTVRPLSGERRSLFLSFSLPFSPESDRPRCFHRLRAFHGVS